MTIEATGFRAAASQSPSDEELVAEIPVAMLEKLREDSRKELRSSSLFLMFCGMFLVTGKNSDFLGSYTDLVFLLSGLVFIVLGLSRFFKSERPSDEMVQAEVKYRRQHGKWRWER